MRYCHEPGRHTQTDRGQCPESHHTALVAEHPVFDMGFCHSVALGVELVATVERVAADAAVPPFDGHNDFIFGVLLAENVGDDVGPIQGLFVYVEPVNHGASSSG